MCPAVPLVSFGEEKVWGVKPRAWCVGLGKCSTTEPHPWPFCYLLHGDTVSGLGSSGSCVLRILHLPKLSAVDNIEFKKQRILKNNNNNKLHVTIILKAAKLLCDTVRVDTCYSFA